MMTKKIWMETTQIKPSFCPTCFRLLDAVSSVYDPSAPVPGDFTICIDCCSVLQFDASMTLVLSAFDKIPIQDRAAFAGLKRTIEEAKIDWDARGGRPWCNR